MDFFEKIKAGLTKTKNALFGSVNDLLKNFVRVDEDMLEELEELLIAADIGVQTTEEILDGGFNVITVKRVLAKKLFGLGHSLLTFALLDETHDFLTVHHITEFGAETDLAVRAEVENLGRA